MSAFALRALVVLVLGVVVAVVINALAWLALRAAARRRFRLQVGRVRQETVAAVEVDSVAAGQVATLRGKLIAGSGDCKRLDDDAAAAVSTLGVTIERLGRDVTEGLVRVQDQDLYLQVGTRRVRLQGDVELLVGSRETWPARRLGKLERALRSRIPADDLKKWRRRLPIVRSVMDGDEVLARGALARGVEAEPGAEGYRGAAARLALQPPAKGEPIAVTATGQPELRLPVLRSAHPVALSLGAVISLLALVLAALVVHHGISREAACSSGERCKAEGLCTYEPAHGCVPSSDADCEQSTHCRDFGDCVRSPDGTTCQPASDEDCRRSLGCSGYGTCTMATTELGVYCFATRNEDCRNAEACRVSGRCHALDGKKCLAQGEVDCLASDECRQKGKCHLHPEARFGTRNAECIASTDADCQHSDECQSEGRCTLGKFACDTFEAASGTCARAFHCGPAELCVPTDGECVAGRAEPSAASSSAR